MIDFTGKVVLVTGGGAGIGRATVAAFADLGATVAVLEIQAGYAAELRRSYGEQVVVVDGDASAAADVTAVAEIIGQRFGRLDVLVNNVGHVVTRPMRFENLTDEQIDDVYRLNLKHMFLVTRTMLPLLRAGDGSSSIVVRGVQDRHHRFHQEPRSGTGAGGDSCQRSGTGDHRQRTGGARRHDPPVAAPQHPTLDSLGQVRDS